MVASRLVGIRTLWASGRSSRRMVPGYERRSTLLTVVAGDATYRETIGVLDNDYVRLEDGELLLVDGRRVPCESATTDPDPSSTPSEERAVLLALFDATGGLYWANSANWNTVEPVGQWYGVTTDSDGYIVSLDLSSNGLLGVVPAQLTSLTRIGHLDLSNNHLASKLPARSGGLSNLSHLDLSNNRLSGVMPFWLASLANLRHLDLGDNALGEALARRDYVDETPESATPPSTATSPPAPSQTPDSTTTNTPRTSRSTSSRAAPGWAAAATTPNCDCACRA